MNRLWVRLTLAFIAVALLTTAAVAGVVSWNAGRQFRGYLAQPAVMLRGGALNVLEQYYAQNGSWEGVENFLRTWRPRLRGRLGREATRPMAILIADERRRVVYDELDGATGRELPTEDLRRAVPVLVDNQVVGYVLALTPVPDPIGQPEQRFLDELQRSILIAALASAGLGILLGLWFSRSIARPLAQLAQAAHAFAASNWTRRVPTEQLSHIAEMKEVALAFNNMADSLQRAEAQRRNLMADVAHELRTPLTVIQGLLRALLDGVHPLQLKEVATIYDETRLLSRLVDDVRELTLAEGRQLPLKVQTVNIAAVLQAAAQRFAALADAQQLAVQVDMPAGPLSAMADPDRVAQVLQNLIGNAIRHTPAGGRITLAAQARDRDVMVSVSDTGEGIPAEDLPHVFDRFYRSDKSRARSSGGSGLGLAIVKSLVELMGGAVGAESAPGRGSRFWFTLPKA